MERSSLPRAPRHTLSCCSMQLEYKETAHCAGFFVGGICVSLTCACLVFPSAARVSATTATQIQGLDKAAPLQPTAYVALIQGTYCHTREQGKTTIAAKHQLNEHHMLGNSFFIAVSRDI